MKVRNGITAWRFAWLGQPAAQGTVEGTNDKSRANGAPYEFYLTDSRDIFDLRSLVADRPIRQQNAKGASLAATRSILRINYLRNVASPGWPRFHVKVLA